MRTGGGRGLRGIRERVAILGGRMSVGVVGFLLKRARPQEIVPALRTVALSDSLLFPAAIAASRPGTARGTGRTG